MNNLRYLLIVCALIATGCTSISSEEARYANNPQLQVARDQFMRQDYESAAITLIPLAKEGNADAEYSLGYLYYYGMGVPQNPNYGRQLIQSAAEQGNERAIEALTALARQSATFGPNPNKGKTKIDPNEFD